MLSLLSTPILLLDRLAMGWQTKPGDFVSSVRKCSARCAILIPLPGSNTLNMKYSGIGRRVLRTSSIIAVFLLFSWQLFAHLGHKRWCYGTVARPARLFICRVCISAGRRMGTCEEMAGALEERMRWMAGATEAADKAKAASDASVEAAKTALKSEPDPRGGTQVNVCFHDVLRQIKLPQLFSAWLNIARWVDILAGLSCVLRLYRSTRVSRPLAGLEPGKRACKRPALACFLARHGHPQCEALTKSFLEP